MQGVWRYMKEREREGRGQCLEQVLCVHDIDCRCIPIISAVPSRGGGGGAQEGSKMLQEAW